MNLVLLMVLVIVSYLVGSIPTGFLLVKFKTGAVYIGPKIVLKSKLLSWFLNVWLYLKTKYLTGFDIRKFNSGNPGATNVLRFNKTLGIITLILDVAKTFVAIYWIAPWICGAENIILVLTGAACIVGNTFPIWFQNRKGGKAVATSVAVFAVLTPYPLIVAVTIWMSIVLWHVYKKHDWKKYVFFASISAGVVLAISYFGYLAIRQMPVFDADNLPKAVIVCVVAALMFVNHKKNLSTFLRNRKNKQTR